MNEKFTGIGLERFMIQVCKYFAVHQFNYMKFHLYCEDKNKHLYRYMVFGNFLIFCHESSQEIKDRYGWKTPNTPPVSRLFVY